MAATNHLFGACTCDRNQYVVTLPSDAETRRKAQVFFDNSAANRRSQATPLTAWLRVPLDWYHSATIAQFPDETHASIKRAYYTAQEQRPVRRQFCGYCGTHLTAWKEGSGGEDVLDVTVGSLMEESLGLLEELGVLGEGGSEEEEESAGEEGLVRGGRVNEETHIAPTTSSLSRSLPVALHRMHGRGIPFFEDLVDDSRLGRIKRQSRGGYSSADGSQTVEWEIIELEPDDEAVMADAEATTAADVSESGRKRRKVGE